MKKRVQLEGECKKLQSDLDDTASRHQSDISRMVDDRDRLSKERDKLSKKLKELSLDYDKLKQRWKKYRARRKMFEQVRIYCCYQQVFTFQGRIASTIVCSTSYCISEYGFVIYLLAS